MHWHVEWTEQGVEVAHTVGSHAHLTIVVAEILLDEPESAITVRPCREGCDIDRR